MFNVLFIVTIICSVVQWIKETCTRPVPVECHNYPEPHRDLESGKIIIENCKLYYEDLDKYGASKARQWVKQGRYNLSPEELKKEEG